METAIFFFVFFSCSPDYSHGHSPNQIRSVSYTSLKLFCFLIRGFFLYCADLLFFFWISFECMSFRLFILIKMLYFYSLYYSDDIAYPCMIILLLCFFFAFLFYLFLYSLFLSQWLVSCVYFIYLIKYYVLGSGFQLIFLISK